MEENNIINNKSFQDSQSSNFSGSGSDSDSISKNSKNSKKSKNTTSENNSNIPRQLIVLPENTEKADLSFKVIVIGDSNVGKSSLTIKAVKNTFDVGYTATIGFGYFSFFVKIDDKVLKLQIWDTCGQEIYQSLIVNFFRNSSLAIMVYSVNNRNSFLHIDNWLKEIKKVSNPDAKIFLIGNKCDLNDEREVSYEEAKKYADDFEFCKFFESSAKTGINVKKIFEEAANILYDDYIEYKSVIYHSSNSVSEVSNSLKLNKEYNNSKSGFCC